jgi:protocatechuate 3,4-dioxygenase beta subunit
VLEVWQADANGGYDLSGYRFRATVRAASDGAFAFRTIVPGRYLNGAQYRPSHIHVKVHSDGNPTLTTQLYFAGDPFNDRDPWFEESLALNLMRTREGRRARFDFVI